MLYLDVIQRASQLFKTPIFAYQVSGEYAMIQHLCSQTPEQTQTIILESLLTPETIPFLGSFPFHFKIPKSTSIFVADVENIYFPAAVYIYLRRRLPQRPVRAGVSTY